MADKVVSGDGSPDPNGTYAQIASPPGSGDNAEAEEK